MPDGTNYTQVGKQPNVSEQLPAQTPPEDPLADPSAPLTTVYRTLCGIVGGGETISPGGGILQVYDEGGIVARTVAALNFVGLRVRASSSDDINVQIDVFDAPVRGNSVLKAADAASWDFVGGGVTVTADASRNVTVSIPEDAILSVFGRTGVITAQNGDYVLGQLGDVVLTNPQTGQTIVFDGAAWRNQVAIQSLNDLTDVALTGPQSGDALIYDGNNWVNQPGGSGAQFLNDLLDVGTAVPPNDGEVLAYEAASTLWKNKAASELQHFAFIQVQLTEQGTDTPAVFDGVKTVFSMRDWDIVTTPVTVEDDRPENIFVGLEGLFLHARLHYFLSGSMLQFNTPPPADAQYDIRAFATSKPFFLGDEYRLMGDGVSFRLLGNGVDRRLLGGGN